MEVRWAWRYSTASSDSPGWGLRNLTASTIQTAQNAPKNRVSPPVTIELSQTPVTELIWASFGLPVR